MLTERFGLKPQGKSAPMASSKRPTNVSDSLTGTFRSNSASNGSRSHQNSTFDFNFNSFPSSNKKPHHLDGIDDIFGGTANKSNATNGVSFDYDSIFMGSNKPSSLHVDVVDDIFGGTPKHSVGVDDLLDKIGGLNANGGRSYKQEKAPDFDDLIPGFGGTAPSNNGYEALNFIPVSLFLYV